MRFMSNLNYSFLVFTVLLLIACGGESERSTEYPIGKNSIEIIEHDLDSLFQEEKDVFVEEVKEIIPNKDSILFSQLAGEWKMVLRIIKGKVEIGSQPITVNYSNDSLFEMNKIGVRGNWIVKDSLVIKSWVEKGVTNSDTSRIVNVDQDSLSVSPLNSEEIFKLAKVK